MRITSLLRRSTAVLAASALLSAGGTGLLASTAHAAVLPTPTISGISPDAANNTAAANVTITGSNFVPSADSVVLRPLFTGNEVAEIKGSVPPNQAPGNTVSVSFPLTQAAPGNYDLVLTQTDPGPNPAPEQQVAFCYRCFFVTTIGPPNATSVAHGTDKDRSANSLDVTGSNFAIGAATSLLLPSGQPDLHAFLTVNKDNQLTAYKSAGVIRATYATEPDFTPGKHLVKVTNTDGKSGSLTEFWLPYIATVTPSTRGVGSRNQVITVAGAGIRAGSILSIQNYATGSGCTDVQVGTSTVSADGNSISAPVSLTASCSGGTVSLSPRSVQILGPDGGSFTRVNAFQATAQPLLNYPSPAIRLGRGGMTQRTLTGSGFVGNSVFTFGDPNLTAVVNSVAGNGASAVVTITAAQNAVLGGHDITVTNPDAGTSTTTAPSGTTGPGASPITITPAPLAASVTPAALGRGVTRNVTITGSGFEATGTGTGLQITFSRPGITAGTVQVTKGSNGSADTATFPVSVSDTAVPGLSHITLKNLSDGGTSVCVDCFGINSLSVTPAADSNSGIATLSINGEGLTGTSDPYLSRVDGNPDQPDIHLVPSAPVTITNNGTTLTGSFDLTNAAPGKYNAFASSNATSPAKQLACSACFTVTGQQATLTAVRRTSDPATVTKAAAGQGATNVPLTLTGTGFSRGAQVVLQTTSTTGTVTTSTATVHDVRFFSPTQLTAMVDVPADAPTGSQDVVLKNGDGALPSTYAGGFTINPGPAPTAVSPAATGQGAAGRQITITGPGFDPASQVDFGPGITVTAKTVTQGASSPTNSNPPDTLVATINVDEAAATGPRTVTISNPDSGMGSLADKFTINAGPKVQSISPALLQPGAEADVTIIGTGFKDDASQASAPHPVVTIANVTPTVTSVSADGTTMVVHLKAQTPCPSTVDPVCVLGTRAVTVANKTDGGRISKADAFSIAVVPTAPLNVAATFNSAGTAATITWNAPASDGGSQIASYEVSIVDQRLVDAHTVPVSPRSYTATGLDPARRYTFFVKANNGVGTGPAGNAASQFVTALSSTRSKAVPVSGDLIRYTGKLVRSTGAGAPSAAIIVTLDPDVGPTRVFTTYTNSIGVWGFRFPTYYNMTVSARFGGNGTDRAASALTYRFGTATRVVKQTPAGGATTSSSSPLVVTGYVSPAKTGQTVYLRNGSNKIVGQGTVLSDRTFRIFATLPRGSYALRITIGASGGNVAGASPYFLAYRS